MTRAATSQTAAHNNYHTTKPSSNANANANTNININTNTTTTTNRSTIWLKKAPKRAQQPTDTMTIGYSFKPFPSPKNRRWNEATPLLSTCDNTDVETIDFKTNEVAETRTGVGWGGASFLLVNTALGAGMLNYPYAYHQIGGISAAALIQVILLIFVSSTMFILAYCADFNHDDSYHNVLLSMCGKRAQQISAASILLTCYGICITFLVIIGDQYDRLFNSLLHDSLGAWYLDRKFTITITAVLFIWPLCYSKRIDFQRHAR